MKKVFVILIIVIVAGMFLGTGFFLYQKSEEDPVVYETESPFVTNIIKKTVATGSINPRKEVAIKSQVSGVVEAVYQEAGVVVNKGDVIAKIRIIPDMVSLNNAESRLKTAQINYNNAKKELERQHKLFLDKIISEVEYNRFRLDADLRREELEAAESNVQLIKEGASKKAGHVTNLVKATASGMILGVPVKEGHFVIESNTFNEGTTICSIANMESMIFEGKVDESEVGKLEEGLELLLTIGAIEGETFKANLEYISPKGIDDQGAIKFDVRAAVELQEGNFIRAGYSANADIVLDKRDSVLAINESLITFEEEKAFVEIEVGEQKFEKKEIELGLSDGVNVEVLSGLKEEDNIKKI
ncbi:efflux RND transporter periplasmic adaptor subunit [Xanthovirga aplysinae]|uniref:efflux RND transporter periplasmic adaptor subunit n=1 Tax=Xanthovirga aplysinae TaxID=2529853 RepID=UPI0012BBCE09|nr:efflux RND transporter periplasmic adaptor subunit [Xanthovirga aplysinae]MTI32689.1 efflux RND transporter periplasmic adaptor subunit [Xanthovirga aplysinae]